MIENFINSKLKSLTTKQAIAIVEKEKQNVSSSLRTLGCDITEQKYFSLNSEGISLFHYFHNLDWLHNLLQGTSITYDEYQKHHNKLKKRLMKFDLI
jgi:hypothetical protein